MTSRIGKSGERKRINESLGCGMGGVGRKWAVNADRDISSSWAEEQGL